MKSNLYKISGIALALALVVTFSTGIANAEEVSAIDGVFSASASVSVSPTPIEAPLKAPIKPPLRDVIKAKAEANGEVRNTLLEKRQEIRKEATTATETVRTDVSKEARENRIESRLDMREKVSPTGEMFKQATNIRKDIKVKMETRTFEIRKAALIKELTISLRNITNISTRIGERIAKAEANGKEVTDAKALLVVANEKLAKAKVDVAAFEALKTTGTTTTEIELAKPRVLGDTAIKSVKQARDAFQKVIVALARDLGEKLPSPSASASASVTPSSSVSN